MADFEFNADDIVANTLQIVQPVSPPVFSTEFATYYTHESGLLAAIMVPLSNVAAMLAHQDPACRAAGKLIEQERTLLRRSKHAPPLHCMSCSKQIGNARHVVAIVLVRTATHPTHLHSYTLCKGCGAHEAMLRKGLQNVADAYAERPTASPYFGKTGVNDQ